MINTKGTGANRAMNFRSNSGEIENMGDCEIKPGETNEPLERDSLPWLKDPN